MESKGFKDAPSFDLGIDIPSKSTGSITESMLEAAYDKAMKKTEQRTEQMVDKPEEDFILKHVPRQLKDDLYREICKYKYFNPKSDTRYVHLINTPYPHLRQLNFFLSLNFTMQSTYIPV
jgi:hypothetical protein